MEEDPQDRGRDEQELLCSFRSGTCRSGWVRDYPLHNELEVGVRANRSGSGSARCEIRTPNPKY